MKETQGIEGGSLFPRPRTMVAAGVASASLLLSGCFPQFEGRTCSAEGATIAVDVVGDSLTFYANGGEILKNDNGTPEDPSDDHLDEVVGSAIEDDLVAQGYCAEVVARTGGNTEDLLKLEAPERTTDTQVLVVALGTNDLHIKDGEPVIGLKNGLTNLDSFIGKVGADHTVLVEVAETPVWGLDQNAPAWNDQLQTWADERGNISVAPWADTPTTHPDYYKEDNVHHTPVGITEYRDTIVTGATQAINQTTAQ